MGKESDLAASPSKKKPSGASNRRRRREEATASAERERQRAGINERLRIAVDEIRQEPNDPLGNQRFANRIARTLAELLLDDPTLPLEMKAKLVNEQLDRIASTTTKATTAAAIAVLQGKAQESKKKGAADAARVPVGASSPLRSVGPVR